MRTIQSTLSILIVATLAVVLGTSAGSTPTAPGSATSNPVGTYFFETVTQSTGQAVNGFITLHKGGTVTWADQSDFGAAGFLNSTTHGIWKKTGPDQVAIEGYYYRFDASGTPVVLVRISTIGSLVTGQGTGRVDVWGPDQNPVLEAPLVANADSITLTSFRLE